MTLAIEYPFLVPVAFLIHPGSPHDSRLFPAIPDDLKRRRVIRAGDRVICDKGYYAYDNYARGVKDYRIAPLIFLKNSSIPRSSSGE
ncbi:MAG: transposase [Methanomicrobiaceae archaeon]|nr:transposase [Methanomicrobiaceae archaeon]